VPAIAAPAAPASVADAQSQAAAARAKLASMRANLADGMSTYNAAASDLASTRADIARNNRELDKLKESIKVGQRSLSTQADFLYRTDGTGFVDVLLGAKSFDEFATRLSVLQTIASKDAGLVASLKQDRARARAISEDLKNREARQEALVSKVAAQRDSVQGSLDQQEAYYNSLSSQVAALVNAQDKAEAAAASSHASAPAPSSSGGKTPPAKKAPPASSGAVALKQATVSGRSGKWWVMASDSDSFSSTGVKFSGEASVYSVAENGTGTASGRHLNDRELTCAHRRLPFGTRIAVTHGGRRIICVVTDRGPYTSGRVIDLTVRGASLLNIDGVGQVSCEVVDPN
jgi:rare lipoprotein A